MASPEPGGFRRIGERPRFQGAFIRLVLGTFVDPDGFTFERDIVRHPGAVCIVPLRADGEVLMVRQYRAPIDAPILELPAGKLDVPGEAVETSARRELLEEIGYEAATLTPLGRFYNSPGFTDELTFCFLAEGLASAPRATQGVEEHHMTVEHVPLEEAFALVERGELVDGKSMIGLSLAREHLRARALGV